MDGTCEWHQMATQESDTREWNQREHWRPLLRPLLRALLTSLESQLREHVRAQTRPMDMLNAKFWIIIAVFETKTCFQALFALFTRNRWGQGRGRRRRGWPSELIPSEASARSHRRAPAQCPPAIMMMMNDDDNDDDDDDDNDKNDNDD